MPIMLATYSTNKIIVLTLYAVPEENRDLSGRDFCANVTFSRKIAIFRNFRLGAQFLREFGTLRRANFPQKFANLFVFSR